ncbi:alpha/beta fold hydrolase [Tsukamurella sp. 1534]|uniref:alpha/beta fold hydrolase n=1 Tax=Tsukamurella sp. 1534 TaxID=1151061 RepID=UPI0002EE9C42|nr:alpha/beta fold hydrolase [Tsukamurella sp. 1534]
MPVGRWRSGAGRDAYLAAYDRVVAALPAHETADVPTAFGTVRAYRFGSADGTPLVLLPGRGSGAPMWRENLPGLAERRTVYALDALGDAGRSEQTAPLRDAADLAAWIDEALAGLGVGRAHVVGHSLGGWSAVNLAARRPRRVASATALDPVLTFGDLRWQMYAASVLMVLPGVPRPLRDRALGYVGGGPVDREDPLAAMVALGNQHYEAALPRIRRIPDDVLRGTTVPVYAALAADSAVNGDARRAADTARDLVPDVVAEVWPGTSHSLPMERPERVAAAIERFTRAHE